MDHYSVLQVDHGATVTEIKVAYKKLARQYHPDKAIQVKDANPQSRDDFESKLSKVRDNFSRISASYEILSDPLKKAKYDYEMGYLTDSADIQRLHRIDAEKAVDLMRLTFDIKRRTEFARQGLIIDDAYYGSPVNKSKRVNVTRPLQCMVQGSRLVIPKGDPKYLLIGFFDPCPSEDKVLNIRYYFRGKLHETTRNDTDKVLMPLKSHLLRRTAAGDVDEKPKKDSLGRIHSALLLSVAVVTIGIVAVGIKNLRTASQSQEISTALE